MEIKTDNKVEICVGDIIQIHDKEKDITYKTTVAELTDTKISWYYKDKNKIYTINIKINTPEDLQTIINKYSIKILFKNALVVDTIEQQGDNYINLDDNTCKCLFHKWQSIGNLYAIAYLEGSCSDSQSTVRHLKRYGVEIDSIQNDSLGAFLSCVEYDVSGSWGLLNELYDKLEINEECRIKYTTQEEFDKEMDKVVQHNKVQNGRKIIHSYDNTHTPKNKKI